MSEPDVDLLHRIQNLVDEEHELRGDGEGETAEDAVARLRHVEEQLDQCWDLLRQRRARREAGQDASDTAARSTDTVEHYLQ